MSFYSNRSRHVYASSPSSHTHARVSMRPNLSWSTIREESSADLLSSEDNEKQDRLNRLKKLERLKERRYMDYQSLKRRGSSKDYSDRFQRDCEEFNKLKYRQVHHTPSSSTLSHQKRSASVSDLSSQRLHSSRYGSNYSFLRGNQDDGQTLSPAGSISSIVTLDDNYMYGSGYPSEDLWRPRSRTSSFSARDRMGFHGLSYSHDMEDSLFDDASSEYGYSSYVPQRRAFSSCVTPRKYSGIMTPTAQSADAMATYERMNQLSDRLRLLQSERVQLDQRHSADHSSSQTRSRLSSFDNTESATASSVHSRFNQTSQPHILPQSPTDHSIPAWSQRVSLLLSEQQHEVPYSPSDADYRSSHGYGSHYTIDSFSRNSPDIADSTHLTDGASTHNLHTLNQSRSNCTSPTVRSSVLSRSFVYHRPESSSTPIATTSSAMRHDRVNVQSPGHLSGGTRFDPTSPTSPSQSYKDHLEFQTSHSLYANQNTNLESPTNSFSRTEYSTRGQQRLIGDNTFDNFSRTANQSQFTSDMSPSPVSPDFHKNTFGVRDRRSFLTHGQQETQLSSQDDVSDSGVESSSDVGRVSSSVSTDSISKFMVSASKPSESRGKTKFEIPLEPSAQREVNSQLSPGISSPHDSIEADKYISNKVVDVSRKEKTFEVESPASTKRATMNIEISQPEISGTSHLPEDKTLFQPHKTDSEIKKRENVASTTTIVKTVDTYSTEMKEQVPGIGVQSFKSSYPIKDTVSQVTISTNKVSETVPFDRETERIESHSKRPDEKYTDNVSGILSLTPKETTSMISKTISNKFESDDVSARKNVGEPHPEEAVYGNGSLDVTESRNQDISDQNVVTSKKKKSKKKKKNGVDTVSTTEEISVSTVESSVDLRPDSTGLDSEKSPPKVSVSSKLVTKKESDNLERAAKLPAETFTSTTQQSFNETVTSNTVSSVDLQSQSKMSDKETVKQQESEIKNISLNVGVDSKMPEMFVQTTTKTDVQVGKSVVGSDVDQILPQNQIIITPNKVPLLESEEGLFETENIQSKSPEIGNLKTKISPTKSSKLDNTVAVSEKDLQTSTNGTANVTLVKSEQLMDATRKSVEKLQSGNLNSLENGMKEVKPTPVSTKLTSTSFQASSSVDNILIQEPSRMKGKPSAISEDISTETVVQSFQQETIEPEYSVTDSSMKEISSENDKTVTKKEKSKKKKKNSSKNGKKGEESDSLTKESVQVMTKEVSPRKLESFSAVFPGQQEVNISERTPQTGLPEKVVVTSLTKTTVSKMSELPEEYNMRSVSAELPGQTPQLTEFSQGNMADKTAPTIKIAGSKMVQGIPDESADYKIKSFPAQFPGQSVELGKDDETITITKTTSVEVESGFDNGTELVTKKSQDVKLNDQVDNSNQDPHAKVLVSTEKSERPQELNIPSIPTEQTENSSFFGRVASTLKNTFSKVSPEIHEKSEFTVPSIADFSADSTSSVDPYENSKDQAPDTTNSVVSDPQAYNVQSVTGKFLEKDQDAKLTMSQEQGDTFSKVTTTTITKTVEYKTSEIPEEYNLQKFSAELPGHVKIPQQTVSMQGNIVDKVGAIAKTTGSKMAPGMSERPEEYQPQSVSAQFPGQIKSPTQTEFSQGYLADKAAPTGNVPDYKMAPGMSERPAEYQPHSVSVQFPDQIKSPTQTEFSQGYLADKTAPTGNVPSYKMAPGMSERPEEYQPHSVSAQFPGQIKSPTQTEFSQGYLADKAAPTGNVPSYKMAPGMSERPAEYQPHSVSVQFPGQIKSPTQTEFSQGYLADKTAPTGNVPSYKMAPGMSERPEEYQPHSVSAQFPGQIKSPTQTEFSQGYLADKAAPTGNVPSYKMAPGMSERPAEYQPHSVSVQFPGQIKSPTQTEFSQGYLADKTAPTGNVPSYKMAPGMSERPEEYQPHSVSAQFPGQIKSPTQTEFSQGYLADKAVPTGNVPDYKMAPGMSERPAEYQPHSVSVQFPGQIKSPTQTEFSQGYLADKTAPTGNVPSYKMAPGMSERPEEYQPHSVSAQFPGQIKSPTQTEFNQGYLADKVVTTTVTSVSKVVPEMSDTPVEFKAPSMSVNFPVQVAISKYPRNEEPVAISTETVTTTETIVEKIAPEISNSNKQPWDVHTSKSPKEIEFIQQGDLFGKEMISSKDVAYKKGGTDSEKPVELKAQTMSIEIPGHQLDLKKAKIHTEVSAALKGNEKSPAESTTISVPTTKQPNEQPQKDKPGFLDKVAMSIKNTFTKKSEEFPERVKESSTVDQNTVSMPSDDKTSYTSVVESGTILPKTTTQMQEPIKDSVQKNKGTSPAKDGLNVDASAKIIPEPKKLQSIFPSDSQQTDMKGVMVDEDVQIVKTTQVTEQNGLQSISMEIPIIGKDVSLAENVAVTSITKTTVSKMPEVPEENHLQKMSTEVKEKMSFPQNRMTDEIKSIDKITGIKMAPGMSERPEEYQPQSVSAQFPGQIKSPTQTEFSQGYLADKVAPTVNVPSYKMAPGMSERPEEYQPHSVSAQFPGQIKSPTQTEFSQGYLADKVAPTVNVPSYKMAPGMSERPEEYQPHSVSAQFPGQIKSPTQTEFSQGYLADKVAPTVNVPSYKMAPGMSERPEEYQPQSVSAQFPGQIKSPTQTEFSQGYLADKVAPTVNVPSYKMAPGMSERPEEYQLHSVSAQFPGQIKSPTQTEFSQGYLADKVAPTGNVPGYKMAPGMSERPEEYQPHSVSAQFPGQIKSPTQTEFSQGYLADKVAPTVNVPSYKMAPGMSERPEEYQPQSVSAQFPGQIKSPTQTEFSQGYLADKVAPTVNVPSYKMAPGMSERPEEYQPHSVSAQFPGQIKSPTQTEFSQGYLADKVAPTVNVPSYKMAPGMSERPEEYQPHSVSAQFSGQIKSPTQTEFSQGYLADKVAPTVNVPSYKMAPGMSERPEEYQPHSVSAQFPGQIKSPTQTEFSQGYLADKVAPTVNVPSYKMAPGMSERPEEYQPQSVPAQFPGQIKSPTQTEFSQGYLADKVAPTVNVPSYKMAPGMSERPEEYRPHSVSVQFPGQIKSPNQTEFNQGYLADKVVTTTVSSGYKTAPAMSEMMAEQKVLSMSKECPGLVGGSEPDQSMTYASQISYKTVLEKGINEPRNSKDSAPNVSSVLSGEHPGVKTASFETSDFALEKPVTIVKTPTDLTNSSRIQEPETSLSQHDPKYVFLNSTEFQGNLKSSETDAITVTDSSELLTTSAELPTLTRKKSWPDIVKNSKTDDVSVEKSPANISSSVSIDKVEKSGDRSPYQQQTENEGRFMSGGPEAVVLTSPKVLEHAGVLSEDVVAPLKSKPVNSDKPVLRKLSGHDLLVSDIQKTSKPSLKLVAPDCTLLQTKFETDGWKPKLKSPTTTGSTIVQTPNNDDKTQAIISENVSISPPVPPKRRSREFRSMSEERELSSPTSPLDFKITVDPQITSPQPQVPKRKNRKGSKSDRSSVSPDPSGATDANLSLNQDHSRPISHPGFRVPDPDQDTDVFRNSSHIPSSHPDNENREKINADESTNPLIKSPHTSVASEIQMRSPNVSQAPPSDHTDSVFGNTPSPDDPPFERSLSSDRSQTMPLHRRKINRRSHDNNDSDSDEKLKSQLSPTIRWKSAEILKVNPAKTETPPKNTGLNRVKSTSIKLLSKLQPKSKKTKSPSPTNDEDTHPDGNSGNGATREYPNLEKYPVRRKSRRRGNRSTAPSPPTTAHSENPEAAAAAYAPVTPLKIPLPLEEHDEPIKERVYLSSWDPTPLLKELYEIRLMEDDTQDLSHKFITMEGLMEKLPMNKKKATLLKTWKRRYFKAENGWLNYYDNRNDEKPSDAVLLMGGQIHAIGNNVIGIDDGRGRYLMVRCPSQNEYKQWLIALESQTPDNTRATYVRPSMNALKHPVKKVVMIEFGSMSIRAGTLKAQATLPQLFFPNIVAISTEDNRTKHVIGFDAYKPDIRRKSHLVQPLGPTDKVDKFKFDYETLPSVFKAIFQDLKIASAEYQVMLILPMNIRDEDKTVLMNILMDQFKVRGVLMASQALLALYSYNAQSGIIVDIGERLEVLPIYEGFVIDGGHTVQSFGAPKIRQSLRSGLTCENYPLYSPLEQLLVRFVMEDTCFVSKNFNEECKQYQTNPEKYKVTVYLKKYDLPEETYSAISHGLSRFVSPEGLFNTDLWGMDYPTVQSLVKNAVEACSMDNRRHLCRSIYLSGGVTLLPGFASRLEAELCKQLNETLIIQVHASPQRYHAAYVGACTLCSSPEFEKSCITSEEWKTEGAKAFQKWKMSS